MKTFLISAAIGIVAYAIATNYLLDPGFFHQASDYEWSWNNAKRITVMSTVIGLGCGFLGLFFTAFISGCKEP